MLNLSLSARSSDSSAQVQACVSLILLPCDFWLLIIVTGARRAEGSPSPLSAHGGAAGANV